MISYSLTKEYLYFNQLTDTDRQKSTTELDNKTLKRRLEAAERDIVTLNEEVWLNIVWLNIDHDWLHRSVFVYNI